MKTIEQAQKDYDGIVEHNSKRIEDLEARIRERATAGHGHEDLDKELDQILKIASKGEERARQELDKVLENSRKEQAEKEKQIKAESEAATMKLKKKALQSYILQGGKKEEFESAWPALREKMLESAVVSKATETDKRDPILRSL